MVRPPPPPVTGPKRRRPAVAVIIPLGGALSRMLFAPLSPALTQPSPPAPDVRGKQRLKVKPKIWPKSNPSLAL
jgi:hypothetical protein